MADYKHGIDTTRDSDISIEALEAARVQVVIGTAPINLVDDPSSAVNVPFLVSNKSEVKEAVGYNTDYENYTINQAVLASFEKIGVAPMVVINVLDPSKAAHKTAVAGTSYPLTNGSTTINAEGVLLDTLVVSVNEETGVADTDYVAAFDSDGHPVIAITTDGKFASATALTIAYSKLNPAGVTADDIIGGISAAGVRTGIELVDEVYSRFEVIPDIILAPKYSRLPSVAAALEAKAELVGDLTHAVAVVDIESTTTRTVQAVETAKNTLGCFSRWVVLCWPKVLMAGYEIYASAAVAAMLQYTVANNNDVPTSPDNKKVPIDGVVLDGGTELHLTKKQVNNYLNAFGVLSFAYLGGWKCWGNNTAAYPDKTEPNNRFIKSVMMSNYLENRFKTEYLSEVGEDGSTKLIDSIVSNYNADLNALVPDYLAGASVVFDKSENPLSEILEGHYKFHTRYADWTPMEYIENDFTWDSKILEEAFEGGE
ncbi:hypothetical protein [Pseudobutyrivibrio sp.]|uniref:hypothetical protein n=1 Tax=Pseudobutyrivibrio sp. TaxID=2014367 RepID=UPI001D37B828|nr:hypothetical protein [Pseudobutyrivibrio sp.]MBE5910887.1 hypothetical protein [Pseudobutyrivibrio sp.]